MATLAIIGDSACAKKFIETIKEHGIKTEFVRQFIPEDLPQVIDDVELIRNSIPKEVLTADVICDYSGHPDMKYVLCDAKVVICSNCFCSLDINDEFGVPEFEVELNKKIIKNIGVIKSSPCGAAYFLAEKLEGMKIDDALSKVGLLTQNACMGSGGPVGAIHKASEIHKKAIERAVIRGAKG